ncbi:hypothetical protein R1flu_029255 [Riccia fluitans]|uniref:Fungal lipase-type domain-containing protein n=1 Tax=Riccia fluitans TaxID=41844 RepID=A0ABD1XP02_9MARC
MATLTARIALISNFTASSFSRQGCPKPNFSKNQKRSAWSVRCSAGSQTLTEISHTKTDSSAWKTFVEHVSGEWDGYGADFTFTGEPLELPSSVVPDAFRDWGVEIHDWQTMCPTLASEEPQNLKYRVIRLLPTVGCEADAATPYITEERDLSITKTFAFHSNGSYSAVWKGKGVQRNSSEIGRTSKVVVRDTDIQDQWEVEHCLVREKGSNKDRARILQQFRIEGGVPILRNITVYIEQWDGPFRNGESLGGCSTSGSGFATTAALETETLTGSWQVESFTAEVNESSPEPLNFEGSSQAQRSPKGEVVALPKGLWSSVKALEDGRFYRIEAGWLVTPDESIVSEVEYLQSGDFKSSCIRGRRWSPAAIFARGEQTDTGTESMKTSHQGTQNILESLVPKQFLQRQSREYLYNRTLALYAVEYAAAETSYQNWAEDLYFRQLDLNYPGIEDAMVHSGFYSAYHNTTLREGVVKGVQAILATRDDLGTIVTGHSMGGAMASLCALDLAANFGLKDLKVITFGQPRIGNSIFAAAYYALVPNTVRMTHNHDIVPHLPPYYTLLGEKTYHHFATEVWIFKIQVGRLQYEFEEVCDSSGEDPDCSRSVMVNSITDHLQYLGVYLKRVDE